MSTEGAMTDSTDSANDNAIEQKQAMVYELACGLRALAAARYEEAGECFRAAALWAEAASRGETNMIEVDGRKWQVQIVPRTPPSDDDLLHAGEGVL